MRYESRTLIVPAEVAEGQRAGVSSLQDLTLQVTGTFDAELQPMGQAYEGGPFTPVGDPITEPGWYPIAAPLLTFRLDTTAFTSGDPVAVLAGLNHRGE